MADGVFNIAKGRMIEFHERVNGGDVTAQFGAAGYIRAA
jgi:hypothetical protein